MCHASRQCVHARIRKRKDHLRGKGGGWLGCHANEGEGFSQLEVPVQFRMVPLTLCLASLTGNLLNHCCFCQVKEDSIFSKVLEPEGGASDVGLSIVNYVNKHNFNATVIGNRCESGFQK